MLTIIQATFEVLSLKENVLALIKKIVHDSNSWILPYQCYYYPAHHPVNDSSAQAAVCKIHCRTLFSSTELTIVIILVHTPFYKLLHSASVQSSEASPTVAQQN